MWCNDPEDMVKAKYIIVWGANPAWCSMHTMKYIYEARQKGAKVVVIDPILPRLRPRATCTGRCAQAAMGPLALGMARHLLDSGLVDQDFVKNRAVGFDEFAAYLRANVTVEWAGAGFWRTQAHEIRAVTEEFASAPPATVWIGYGMAAPHQRRGHGARRGCLCAMTGQRGR